MNRKKRSGPRGAAVLALAAACLFAACSGGTAPGPSVAAAGPAPSSRQSSAPVPETRGPAGGEAAGTKITLTFGDTVMTATVDDSETTRAFLALLPLTLEMDRYADREYYAAIGELPETGEAIDDFENGDITYYTTGRSLAIFFGNADSSSQTGLIRMGKITSDLRLFDLLGDSAGVTIAAAEREEAVTDYDLGGFTNVEIMGIDLSDLSGGELAVLFRQARYCQAMTEADIGTMDEIVSDGMVFTHMSGRQQTKEEYFADVADGSLRYFRIGIEDPVVKVEGSLASVTYTSVLDADAYGAQGTYRMSGTHWFEKRGGDWYAVNGPDQ